jgi:succinate dehydrogenase / fumarate reductase, iron-sulfur subunit
MEDAVAVISIQAFRFDPDRPAASGFQTYVVPTQEPLSVMALMTKIHEMDASFACRTSTCYKGQCGSCLIRVNGKDVLGCVTLIKPGEAVRLEPHSKYRVIRDVVVDFSAPAVES